MKLLKLTGCHGAPILVNPDFIAFISQATVSGAPDQPAHSAIFFPSGQSCSVRETCEEIVEKAEEIAFD